MWPVFFWTCTETYRLFSGVKSILKLYLLKYYYLQNTTFCKIESTTQKNYLSKVLSTFLKYKTIQVALLHDKNTSVEVLKNFTKEILYLTPLMMFNQENNKPSNPLSYLWSNAKFKLNYSLIESKKHCAFIILVPTFHLDPHHDLIMDESLPSLS